MAFTNSKKKGFLASRPQSDIEGSGIAQRCKFNFSFFDASQEPGQNFSDWGQADGSASLVTLLEKIKEYTKHPLNYWRGQRVGGGGLRVLEQYSSFPNKSDFTHPAHVPHDVVWARFRLAQKVRLVGFVIPGSMAGKEQEVEGKKYILDAETFYVVFLDKNHQFYKLEQK